LTINAYFHFVEASAFEGRGRVDEQETRQGPLGRGRPLQSERGVTRIADGVVQKIAGIAAMEVEGVQMGGGFLESVTGGGGGITRGVSVEVGEVETAIDLTMAVEYGKPIPQLSNEVRRHVVNRVGGLVGLDVVDVSITVTDVLLPEGQ
jgi:uncharacterized alkaline shock family protein YloU